MDWNDSYDGIVVDIFFEFFSLDLLFYPDIQHKRTVRFAEQTGDLIDARGQQQANHKNCHEDW